MNIVQVKNLKKTLWGKSNITKGPSGGVIPSGTDACGSFAKVPLDINSKINLFPPHTSSRRAPSVMCGAKRAFTIKAYHNPPIKNTLKNLTPFEDTFRFTASSSGQRQPVSTGRQNLRFILKACRKDILGPAKGNRGGGRKETNGLGRVVRGGQREREAGGSRSSGLPPALKTVPICPQRRR